MEIARHLFPLLYLLLLLASVPGAAADASRDSPVATPGSPRLIEVDFVSNRTRNEGAQGGAAYGNEIGALSGGRCVVDVGARRGRGELVEAHSGDYDETLERFQRYRDSGLIVYIHGYYEDFERSCRRAAVFKSRLGLDSGFLLFSWPANSTPFTYAGDVADLEASTPRFTKLLRDLSKTHAPDNISVVAHSLGTRGLVEALRSSPAPSVPLRDLVLIASDMDREAFLEVLPELRERAADITLFVSGRDLPLRLSSVVNRGARLGQSSVDPIDGVRIIDVTDYEITHLSGHVYHLRNPSVLAALGDLLRRPGRVRDPVDIGKPPDPD